MDHAYTGRVRAPSNLEADAALAAYQDAVDELGLDPVAVRVRAVEPQPTVSRHETAAAARPVIRRCPDLRLHPEARYAGADAEVTFGAERDGDCYVVDAAGRTVEAAERAREVVEDAFGIEMREPGFVGWARARTAGLYDRVRG